MIIIGPLWFINFFLIIIFTIFISFIGLNKDNKIKYIPIKKTIVNNVKSDINNNIDFPSVLDRDIFNAMPVIPEEEKRPKIQPVKAFNIIEIPNPPEKIEKKSIHEDSENFLPPLQLTIKGTIITDNSRNNRVFIENNRTKDEKGYSIGDLIEDSQIVYIGKIKVIFIRSNGQQEIIFVNKASQYEDDKKNKILWNKIIEEDEEFNLIKIDLRLLEKKVHTIGHFLDELSLITYFEKDIPVGCQVGRGDKGSLADHLKLEAGDIIKSINHISVATQDSRIQIYESLFNLNDNKSIKIIVEIIRNNNIIVNNYEIYKSSYSFENSKKNFHNMGIDEEAYSLNRSINKKYIVESQINQGNNIKNNLDDIIDNDNIKNIEKGGKKNVLYRN